MGDEKEIILNKQSAFQLRTHDTGLLKRTKFTGVNKQTTQSQGVTDDNCLNASMIFNCSHKTFECHKYLKKFSIKINSSILTIWFWKRSHHAHLFNQELDKESTIVKTIKETWGHRQHIRNQRPVHYWSQVKIFKPDVKVNILSWLDVGLAQAFCLKNLQYRMIGDIFSCKIVNSDHNRGQNEH